jgi:hypothetical protein
MLLRPDSAGSNTVTDHIQVLAEALAQLAAERWAKILVRIDGAGATHDLLTHLEGLNTARRTVRYTVGWMITAADEAALAALPGTAWGPSLHQDAGVNHDAHVAELTGLSTRQGWPPRLRLIARRTHSTERHKAKLTAFERATGWRYAIVATNLDRIRGVPGSHHPQWIDILHPQHACVEDRVRTNKDLERTAMWIGPL